MIWQTPKTDWVETDSFEKEDFNRIKNNTYIVANILCSIKSPFEIDDMGEDIESYTELYDVDNFNAIENNIERISNYLPIGYNAGYKQTFYPNGQFIKYTELNRIESIISMFSDNVDGWLNGRISLPMVLGRNRRLKF